MYVYHNFTDVIHSEYTKVPAFIEEICRYFTSGYFAETLFFCDNAHVRMLDYMYHNFTDVDHCNGPILPHRTRRVIL